jgi:pyridoxine kinase
MEIAAAKQHTQRIAAVHDLSGFGRSSLTIVLPVLSVMGIQACPLPTALLSTQTSGFEDYYFLDLTDSMKGIIAHWEKLGISFNGVYSGFLGSSKQISIVSDFIDHSRDHSDALILVDPVLGDDGETYGTITPELVAGMRNLVRNADIITPNYTEAALLLDKPMQRDLESEEIKSDLRALADLGPGQVIITSIPVRGRENFSSVYAYNRVDETFWKVCCEYLPASYPGTGDMFASVIMGSLLTGDSFPEAIDRAVQFVFKAIRTTYGKGVPARNGVLLERVLSSLLEPVHISTYELVD